jgi:tetratricopeptide (TPR) repeat protein
MGGVQGAVATWGDGILNTLSLAEQQLAVTLMCQMVGFSSEHSYELRKLRSDQIPEALRQIAPKLVSAGLVIAEATGSKDIYSYSLFHLSLALRLPRLRTALAQNADFLRWREAFRSAAEEYSLRQSYSALLRGDALATAQNWLGERPGQFTKIEIDFIHRSEEEARRTDATLHKQWPRTAVLASSLAIAVLIAVVSYLYFCRPRPDSVSTLIAHAYENRQQNHVANAIADLTKSLTLQPESKLAGQIYSDRAYCYKLAHDWEKSIPDLTAALASETALPDKIRLLNDRSYAHVQMREPDAALADSMAVLELDNGNSIAAPNRDWLTTLSTPKVPGMPHFFIFTLSKSIPDGIPQAVRKLWPKTVDNINYEGWEDPIPENELRYNDPHYKQIAQDIHDVLARGGLVVKGPIFTRSSVSSSIELWLATRSHVISSK